MDKIKKYLACDGRISIIIVETTEIVKNAKEIHKLSPIATKTLGEVLTMGVIMGSILKNEEDNITIQIKGNGPIGNVVCVVNGKNDVKGYVWNPELKLDINENAIGDTGNLYVIKDLGLKDPYIGISPIDTGNISEIFNKYYRESEQTKNKVYINVNLENEDVKIAEGYMIIPMPDASDEDIKKICELMSKSDVVGKILEKDMVMLQEENTKYECECNREKFKDGIKSLSKKDIEDIFEKDNKVETVCQFCNRKYEFYKDEIINNK